MKEKKQREERKKNNRKIQITENGRKYGTKEGEKKEERMHVNLVIIS